MTALDKRLNAYRDDLADAALKGTVAAGRFVEGEPAEVAGAVIDLHGAPSAEAGVDTQLLRGEAVTVFERRNGWAWIQNRRDGYVGYCRDGELAPVSQCLTHQVCVPRTFVYPDADLKHPSLDCLPMGARLCVTGSAETRGTRYHMLDNGEAVIADHLVPLNRFFDDYVALAETFIHTPYLWGGTSPFGFDCSGLVQHAMMMCGRRVLRDTDMQAETIGDIVEAGDRYDALRRGDLVFWSGHVGIMRDEETLLHASGGAMMVTVEPLREAIDRIARLYGAPTLCRRP